jgi:hypothetical protein
MKVFPKAGLLVLVALLAAAAMATSAQAAITINPGNTAVSGTASNPTLTYGVATVVCNTGTANGSTTNPASASIPNLALTFSGNCAVVGVASATVACQGTVTLTATDNRANDDNPGTVSLNNGFSCVVTTALCTITVAGPQSTPAEDVNLNEDTNVLAADVDVNATRTGSAACGPTSGSANFTANYATTPTNLTVDGTP